MKTSIIIPVFINSLELYRTTIACINSLLPTVNLKETEVIIVDDASPEQKYIGFIRKIKSYSGIRIIANRENLGFAKTVNHGIRESNGDVVVLLNNDTVVRPTWLELLTEGIDQYDISAPAFGKMNRENWSYVPGEIKTDKELANCKLFSYPVGWCVAINRGVFDKIGMIPEDFGMGFWEDTLFGYRAQRAGLKTKLASAMNVGEVDCKIKHIYHATFKKTNININTQYAKNREIFLRIKDDES